MKCIESFKCMFPLAMQFCCCLCHEPPINMRHLSVIKNIAVSNFWNFPRKTCCQFINLKINIELIIFKRNSESNSFTNSNVICWFLYIINSFPIGLRIKNNVWKKKPPSTLINVLIELMAISINILPIYQKCQPIWFWGVKFWKSLYAKISWDYNILPPTQWYHLLSYQRWILITNAKLITLSFLGRKKSTHSQMQLRK